MTGPAPDARRIYLGWEYALVHPHPGAPPPRPVPPGPEQVNPGWLAAQQREERRLSLPLRLGGRASLGLAGLTAGLGMLGVLRPALTAVGLTGCLLLAAWCARGVWRGRLDLHARVDREEQRVARARAVQQGRLQGRQQEHALAFRNWQARGQAFQAQAHWHGVALPAEIDRVDVAGGTQAGWSALLTMLAGLRLAAGGEVTVLDLADGAAAQDLLAIARGAGTDPLVWVLPADLPRLELGRGLPRHALADVLAVAASAGGDPATPPDPSGLAQDTAILERVATILGDQPSPGELLAGLRVLAQAGDQREDIRAGLISEAQAEAIAGLYGRAAADRVVERALALEARLRTLADLGSSPVPLPPSRLRVVAVGAAAGLAGGQVLGSYLAGALTCLLRGPRAPGPRWQHTVLVSGAETLCDAVLDRLSAACETAGTGLVLAYRTLPPHTRARLGRGNAAVAFMRLGNADDARAASEQIGTEHRFVVAQLTDTVGSSVTDTAGQAYTSTVGAASTAAVSRSASQTSGQSGGHGRSWAGLSAFAARTASAHGETSYSAGTSDSVSLTEGINRGTAWGVQTALAVGANSSLARSSQRSREFLVEQHELQQLPPSAVIVSYAGPAGRRVVLADANPGILGLPTATLSTLDEDIQAARRTGQTAWRTGQAARPAGQAARRAGQAAQAARRAGQAPAGQARAGQAVRRPGQEPAGPAETPVVPDARPAPAWPGASQDGAGWERADDPGVWAPPRTFGQAALPPAAEPSWAGPVPPNRGDFTAALPGRLDDGEPDDGEPDDREPDDRGPDDREPDDRGPLTLEPLPEPLDRWPDPG